MKPTGLRRPVTPISAGLGYSKHPHILLSVNLRSFQCDSINDNAASHPRRTLEVTTVRIDQLNQREPVSELERQKFTPMVS